MHVASAAGVAPGASVLDLCSAPGGKTTHLAELMHDQGRIVACDIDDREDRLEHGAHAGRRAPRGVVRRDSVRLEPGGQTTIPGGPFDVVLVDVPCSNTGVLGRRPEDAATGRPGDPRELAALQRAAAATWRRSRVGNRAAWWSTRRAASSRRRTATWCCDADRGRRPGLIAWRRRAAAVPGRPADGGYWARLRKRSPARVSTPPRLRRGSPPRGSAARSPDPAARQPRVSRNFVETFGRCPNQAEDHAPARVRTGPSVGRAAGSGQTLIFGGLVGASGDGEKTQPQHGGEGTACPADVACYRARLLPTEPDGGPIDHPNVDR